MIKKLVKECTKLSNLSDSIKAERNTIQKYIDKLSEDTGINFWEILEKEKEKLR